MLRELMSFAKVDGDKLGEKAQSLLGELTGELGTILKKEEAIHVSPISPMSNGATEAAPVVAHGGE